MNRICLLVLLFALFFSTHVLGQNVSNEGFDFWAVFPTHVASGNGGTTLNNHANIAVFVTAKSNSRVTVSCGAYTQTKDIPANSAIQFDITWAQAYINFAEANMNLINRGIHIKVEDDKPKVSVYAHMYGAARSAASLILPFETLGQTYYSMNYTQLSGAPQGNNYLTLVAAEANTTLLLHEKNGNVLKINLANPGDVYEYMPNNFNDLTGVYVEVDKETSSCKRFAAFSGSSVLYIACTGSQDPLYQQLYPTVSWGKNYGVVPFIDRNYILRVLAQEDDTHITYNGQTYTLNKGAYHESSTLTQSTYISSDKLISVAQYSLTQACSNAMSGTIIGDPEMVVLNPIEFNIKGITVFSSTLQAITSRYINVLMRADKTSTFKMNDVPVSANWIPLAGNSLYAYAQLPVSQSSITLTADDGFNAIAYGFGQAESYSYSAGTNLSSNNYLTVVNNSRMEEGPSGCVGQELNLKINLPYQADRIIWTLDKGTPEITSNPTPEVKNINGQTIYVYSYPLSKVYTVSGQYHLEIVAHVPNDASNCNSGDLTTDYIFNIYDLPTAKFTAEEKGCAQNDVSFTDQSLSNAKDFTVTEWLWDFGDGKTSTEQNPKHQYQTEGNYNVTLAVKSGAGCFSEPAPAQTVSISPKPISKFNAAAVACINKSFEIVDVSTISSALNPNEIVNWNWDFGDGNNPVNKTTSEQFSYQYNKLGKYTIKLVTTSAKGCKSDVFSFEVTVVDLPIADFSMSTICLADPFAVFTNKSTDAKDADGNLQYEWNFGDPTHSTVANPNTATSKDGKHTYPVAGTYRVSLKITNSNGCESIITQNFVVNGNVEKADFIIQNEASLCSNQQVIINNTSMVSYGNVTKIIIYKDFLNAPENFQTILNPTAEDIALTYPAFGGNAEKKVTIRLVAYSGEGCFKNKDTEISLKPTPQLTFSAVPEICQNDGSVLINQAHETSGILGKGMYTGEGIDEAGRFNPKLVSIGSHLLTYTFVAENGCTELVTQTVVVNKSPVVDAGPMIYILAGGKITIPAQAEGDNLSFKWSPSTGLNRDDVLNPVASPDQDITYTLTVTSDKNCTTTSSVAVEVLQALTPPNVFTPNGDNINDVWNIKYLDTYPNASVEVFNRNGTRVFFSNLGYKTPFDGTFQNEPLPVGVYYYIINPRNGRKTVSGPLTIIR